MIAPITGRGLHGSIPVSLAPARQKRYDGRMSRLSIILLAPLVAVALTPAIADDVAAERARLANQRIQIEEERRAREEEERLAQAQTESEDPRETDVEMAAASEQPGDMSSPPETRSTQTSVGGPPPDRIEMSRALEQLRELGALRDAGYLTEEEFAQLKKKILDGAL